MTELEDLVGQLEDAAARLRSGELEGPEAAALVEQCAELAGRLARELERLARDARAEPDPGQETLL